MNWEAPKGKGVIVAKQSKGSGTSQRGSKRQEKRWTDTRVTGKVCPVNNSALVNKNLEDSV